MELLKSYSKFVFDKLLESILNYYFLLSYNQHKMLDSLQVNLQYSRIENTTVPKFQKKQSKKYIVNNYLEISNKLPYDLSDHFL
jgi:hypothetical protein